MHLRTLCKSELIFFPKTECDVLRGGTLDSVQPDRDELTKHC